MKIIASWDEGNTYDNRVADLMIKYQIPTIFYWPSIILESKNFAFASSWLTIDECKKIANQFEIGSRGYSGRSFKKMNLEQISNEIGNSKKAIEDFTGKAIESYSYPKNSLNNVSKTLVKGNGYTNARTMYTGYLQNGIDKFEQNCTVQVAINKIEYNNISWLLYAEKMKNKADENSIFHFFGNSMDCETFYQWENLENMIKSLLGK